MDTVKDYFGEKIGMYFLFLGHYTTWLISAGVAGFISWTVVAGENNDPNAAIVPYFAAFMSVWSTLMMEYWGRKEKMHAMKWGMVGFEENEQARPQFKGDLIPSPVDGKMFLYFPRNEYMKRLTMSTTIVSGCILVVLGVVVGIFVLKILLTSMRELVVGGTQTGGIIVSIVNAVQIQVMNMIYGSIAIALNNFENHRTDTEYEDALISKTFIFQFINSFSPMFYIAFVKPYIPDLDPCMGSCMGELQTSLGTIFMTRLAVGSITEVSCSGCVLSLHLQLLISPPSFHVATADRGPLPQQQGPREGQPGGHWTDHPGHERGGEGLHDGRVPRHARPVCGLCQHLDPVRVHHYVRGGLPAGHVHRVLVQLHR